MATSIGIMDSAYFVGRNEILTWINNRLQLNLSRIEEVTTPLFVSPTLRPCLVLPNLKWIKKIEFWEMGFLCFVPKSQSHCFFSCGGACFCNAVTTLFLTWKESWISPRIWEIFFVSLCVLYLNNWTGFCHLGNEKLVIQWKSPQRLSFY